MTDEWFTACHKQICKEPAFLIYGKAKQEKSWRILRVHCSKIRNDQGGWPLIKNTLITWTSEVVAMGWDFALGILEEQAIQPASRENPIVVNAGRYRMPKVREKAGFSPDPSYSEILAHECGHSYQAIRLGPAYLPVAAFFTLFREGDTLWNALENEASETGQFGGIVPGSICSRLRTSR